MNARNKLNAAHFQGAVVIAALLGFYTNSLTIFFVALAVMLFASTVSGAIRP